MNQEKLYQVIIAPVVTEKTSLLGEQSNQIIFKVLPSATKSDIKAALKLIFNVTAESVRIVNIKGKQKRFGKTIGRRSDFSKAYISLGKDQEINLVQGV
jgi:large subunit ribosomal protein L23